MLTTLIRVTLQLEGDLPRPAAELRVRDRAVGREQQASLHRPVRVLRDWIAAIGQEEDLRTTRKAIAALRTSALLAIVLGMVFGVGAAAAIYSYDGTRPINILPAIATFVVLPLLLLIPLAVQLLPVTVPGFEALRETLGSFGAGLFALAMRVLGPQHRQLLQTALGRTTSHQKVFGSLQRWTLLSWSQSFAVAFHLGAIAWFAFRVLVTDLSFTWSTTAEFVTAERVHALTVWLSTPWAAWLPAAVPSFADVQATQYFRLGTGTLAGGADPALLGRWWSFLLMSMLVYGFAPRVITATVCAVARARAVRWTLLHLPGVDDVLDRITRWDVRTQSDEPEAVRLEGTTQSGPMTDEAARDAAGGDGVAVLVRWSRVEVEEARVAAALREQLDIAVHDSFEAGAGHSLGHDEEVLAQVAAAQAARERAMVVVLVKAWEPATGEAVDFLTDLRRAVGDAVRIVVTALRLRPLADGDTEDRDVAQWRRRCVALGDPWLRVVGIDAGTDVEVRR